MCEQLSFALTRQPGFQRLVVRAVAVPDPRVPDCLFEATEGKTGRNRLVVADFKESVVCIRNPQRQLIPGLHAIIQEVSAARSHNAFSAPYMGPYVRAVARTPVAIASASFSCSGVIAATGALSSQPAAG